VQESELVYNIENRSRPRAGGFIQLGSVVTSIAAESVPLGRLCPDHWQTGNHSGPEVGFEEIIHWFPRSPFLDNFRFADNPPTTRCAKTWS
jgi:hypothetical protein